MTNVTLQRFMPGPASATLVIAMSAVCFGLVPLFVRDLQAEGSGPATIALYRYGFSALLLLPFLRLDRARLPHVLVYAGAGAVMGLSLIGYFDAMSSAPVAAVGVVYMSYPVFAALFAWLLLRQQLTMRSLAAAALVTGAAALLLDPAVLSPDDIAALVWAIPAPVAFGLLVVVMSGVAGRLTSTERAGWVLMGSVAGLLPLALREGALMPSSSGAWETVVTMGVVTALVPQLLYTVACQRVGPVRTAAAGSFELPTMFLVGWLAFGEAIGTREALSAALVLSAILLAPAVRTTS